MHPIVIQSIATDRARDLREAAQRRRDARLAIDRRERQRSAARAASAVLLRPVHRRVLAERPSGV